MPPPTVVVLAGASSAKAGEAGEARRRARMANRQYFMQVPSA
jgi:hypothetical protein